MATAGGRGCSPEGVATITSDRLQISVGAKDCVGATWSWTPPQVRMVLDKTASDEQLVFLTDLSEREEVRMSSEGSVSEVTSGSLSRRRTVASSTTMEQSEAGHWML